MMFSDVDLLFTNSLSDDLNQNSVTSVIFIATRPNLLRVIALNKHGVSSNFTCVFARTQKKTENFLPLIANAWFISIKYFVGKAFC